MSYTFKLLLLQYNAAFIKDCNSKLFRGNGQRFLRFHNESNPTLKKSQVILQFKMLKMKKKLRSQSLTLRKF